MSNPTSQTSGRFWGQVDRRPGDGECWFWTGDKIRGGYGTFRPDGKTHVIAHRWAWAEVNGPIPEGLFVLHRCDNPSCVRASSDPATSHLFLGTQQDNMDDQAWKGRRPAAKGVLNKHARLTLTEVREIRRLVNEEHQSRTAVGVRFGLNPQYVGEIATGEAWPHVQIEAPAWRGSPGRPRKVRDPSSPIRCGRCREEKPPTEFPPSAAKRGNGYCRSCWREVAQDKSKGARER